MGWDNPCQQDCHLCYNEDILHPHNSMQLTQTWSKNMSAPKQLVLMRGLGGWRWQGYFRQAVETDWRSMWCFFQARHLRHINQRVLSALCPSSPTLTTAWSGRKFERCINSVNCSSRCFTYKVSLQRQGYTWGCATALDLKSAHIWKEPLCCSAQGTLQASLGTSNPVHRSPGMASKARMRKFQFR